MCIAVALHGSANLTRKFPTMLVNIIQNVQLPVSFDKIMYGFSVYRSPNNLNDNSHVADSSYCMLWNITAVCSMHNVYTCKRCGICLSYVARGHVEDVYRSCMWRMSYTCSWTT